jgi:hypothetical protein
MKRTLLHGNYGKPPPGSKRPVPDNHIKPQIYVPGEPTNAIEAAARQAVRAALAKPKPSR